MKLNVDCLSNCEPAFIIVLTQYKIKFKPDQLFSVNLHVFSIVIQWIQ